MPTHAPTGRPQRTATHGLEAPVRNRYFYGKLLDERHLEIEQDYFNEKRWLLNRLGLGAGVLCGLEVAVSAERTRVRVGPGVAVDPLGREIIVDRPTPAVDVAVADREPQPGHTAPSRDVATLYICYHECPIEPAPALVTRCEPEPECEFGLTRERYRLHVRPGLPDPVGLSDEECRRLLGPLEGKTSRRERICRALASSCGVPDDPCVPIATLVLDDDGAVRDVDPCARRRTLYSNAVLFDLLLCLAERVDRCCPEQPAPQ